MIYKNTINKIILVLAIIGILLLSGCTGKDTDQTTSTGDDQGAASDSTINKPAKGSVQAIHFSKLMELLPEPQSGWTADEPTGGSYTVEDGSWSMAARTYKKGDNERATVTIMDSAYYEVGLFTAWKSFVQMETSEGYFKTTKVKGYPAFETYSKSSKDYGLFVNVKDRIMVNIVVDNDDKDALTAIQNSINYAGIEALI